MTDLCKKEFEMELEKKIEKGTGTLEDEALLADLKNVPSMDRQTKRKLTLVRDPLNDDYNESILPDLESDNEVKSEKDSEKSILWSHILKLQF